jgi:hypothetical protein
MDIDSGVTGLCVSHNTKELLETAINSIRKFHPNMKLIIIDGSDETDECYKYICNLPDKNIRIFHLQENIGHGRGLCVGIEYVETPYMLIFDSDIEMLKSPVQAMLDMMDENTYGIGYTEKTAFDGHEWGSKPIHKSQGWMKYLHPYFCLIQKKEYLKYEPFCHHGAPAVNTMLDIYNQGLSEVAIKEFEGLGHSSGKGWVWEGKPREYIRHDTYGTRGVRVKKHQPEIEGTWDKVIPAVKTFQVKPFILDNKDITIITCTGDRPLAFSLCKKWIEQQTAKIGQWIIIDDGKIAIDVPNLPYVNYIRRMPAASDPKHTMILNLKEGIKYILGKKIFFLEDDEYYAPTYLEKMSALLDKYEIVGIGRSKYYHLFANTYHIHSNMGHASLAQTCFRSSFLPEINDVLSGDSYLDIRIWNIINKGLTNFTETGLSEYISKDKRGYIFDDKNDYLYIGMKGMPGRNGIGAGHKGNGIKDINNAMLNKWIRKEDIGSYLTILENKINIINVPLNRPIVARVEPQVQPFNNSPWKARTPRLTNDSGIIKNRLQSCAVKR